MKNILFASFIALFIISCNNVSEGQNGNGKSDDGGPKAEKDKKVSKRDISINKSNAYSDLFFDSLALVNFITENKLSDSVARRMTSFYNTRNYQFAWFTSKGLTEQARGFWNMHNYHTTYTGDSLLKDKGLKKIMDGLIADESLAVSAGNKEFLNTELKLTEDFILYSLTNIEDGYIKRKEMERFIPRKKEDALYLADSLITKKHKDNKYYEDVNEAYGLLKVQLGKYHEIAKAGGWPVINATAKQLKRGTSSPAVLALKKRLQLTGDLAAGDTTTVFDDQVAAGIQSFQTRHGYTPSGVITDALIKDLNVPVDKRIQQILINMGRMQWMVNEPKGQLIMVNIPEFILHVKDGKNKVFDMDVVVGKDGHNTMMFTGTLNQVVFSPYWNVPPSIVKNEILPAMNRNAGYLARQDMEITSSGGGLPVIRQRPGAKNALGRVKFLFPNSFNIYFHDTPSKSLFEKDKRAFSHGCIRLSDPVKMANYLLNGDPKWDAASIEEAMNSGNEQYVKLKNPVPVLITYYTAWVDDAGLLHFADDIYGHDKEVASKMFTGEVAVAKVKVK